MKNLKGFVFLFLSLTVTAGLFAQDAYDSKKVKAAMQVNFPSLRALNKAIETSDFYAIADDFYAIAKANQPLLKMNPPKGSKADWDKDLTALITAALKGVGAAGDKDLDKVKQFVGDLQAAMKAGHGEFK